MPIVPLHVASQLQASKNATADAAGTATAVIGPEKDRTWVIDRMAVHGTSSLQSQCRVYRGDPAPGTLRDSTYSGNQAISEYPRPAVLEPGEYFTVVWSGCTPGATMTVTVEGQQGRRG